jgi:hypothetical protein
VPVRAVNAESFQIGYAVDDPGPGVVSNVELFITEDDGRKWWKYGDDADRHSPFDVKVPRDGRYGFALRVHTSAGAAAPPQPGEQPEMIVVVDLTPPSVELLPVGPEAGGGPNQLVLKWTASDAHPAEQPIALFYAADPRGPWEPIGDWQENRGRYVWTLGPDVPGRVYLRVTARDAAGNVTHSQTPGLVAAGNSRPTARIVDVHPLDAPPRQQ